MDDKEVKNELEEELSLEDILKEFGTEAEAVDEAILDEAIAQMPIAQEPPLEERLKALFSQPDEDEDVKRYIPQTQKADPAMEDQTVVMDVEQIRQAAEAAKEPASPVVEAVTDATVRFEPLGQEPNITALPEATIRFEPIGQMPQKAMSDATVRFAPVGQEAAVSSDATVRFEPVGKQTAALSGDTVRFEPLGNIVKGQEHSQAAPNEEIPEGAEPFSMDWEPEYETPMGEYVPPEPIQFRPASRLNDLKQKIIEGPERRYYALVEQGQGKLQAAIFLSILVVIVSFAAIAMHAFGLVRPERMRLLVFGELFAMMLSTLLGCRQIASGIVSAFKKKFTPDTMLALSFLICMTDGFFCLQEVRVPFCAAFCLEVTMSLWAEYQRRNTEQGQMDTLRKATHLNRVTKAPDCYEGMPGFYVADGEVEDFMDTYTQTTTPERIMSLYCVATFLLTAVIALIAGFAKGLSVGVQTWSAAILAAMPATIFISQSRPMAVLERRFHKLGIVLCGWTGVKEMSCAAAVPLRDTDLFPAGSMKINGVKFYTQREPDQTVAYAAAIMECAANSLTPLFTYLLESRNGYHYDVENYHSYDNGFGGEVNGSSVLMGSYTFLQDMGVEIPEGTRVNQAVYIAIDAELCGVFALAFGKLKGVSAGLSSLCSYRGLTPVMTGNNFLVTEGFLRSKFSVNTRRVAFPTGEQRQAVADWQPDPERSVACALTTQDGLISAAFAITGARALRTCCNLGLMIHMAAGILGMLMVLILTLVGANTLLTPMNLLIYHLVWSIPGMLISSWTRYL